ncbi:MAG: D-alanyl-D-alanine carboxypeptidase [Lachnospiraceae bacterium]|nr:D-alanyl-D-alanine carboxypeptidase [Lachnospiraceae bacterium]
MKRFFSVFLAVCILLGNPASYHVTAQTEQGTEGEGQGAALSLASPSAILLEASTGGVIYEQDADSRRSPASITKIMTLLLIFENLEQGKIHLEDQVTTSAHAKSMGGSQVFLEEGEVQTVDTLIKCIAVASGNDASVAMAEYIAGSEEEFVRMMNEKASQLGMENTHFADCCGLTASDDHYTTARDIAIMSRALITSYPKIFDYTKIWMEDITHVTKQGTKNFTLSSTNKLLKQYPYATGLKTGSTSKAKYCLSATASKDGIDLIAVIMAAPDYKVRFQDASKLLEYGYAVSSLYTDENQEKLSNLMVTGGVVDEVALRIEEPFRYLDIRGNDLSAVTKKIRLPETAEAPVAKGETAGKVVYELNGKEIGSVRILFDSDIAKAVYKDYVKRVFVKFF